MHHCDDSSLKLTTAYKTVKKGIILELVQYLQTNYMPCLALAGDPLAINRIYLLKLPYIFH
jgi:hypothetical protein